MARVDNDDRTLALASLGYVSRELREAIDKLTLALQLIDQLKNSGVAFDAAKITALKDQFMNDAKTRNLNAVKMYRWMFGKLSINIPAAYTDAQVDAIDERIRTREDNP